MTILYVIHSFIYCIKYDFMKKKKQLEYLPIKKVSDWSVKIGKYVLPNTITSASPRCSSVVAMSKHLYVLPSLKTGNLIIKVNWPPSVFKLNLSLYLSKTFFYK